MAEKTCTPSSQESPLLSEETCLLLLNGLGDNLNTYMTDDTTLQAGSDINLHEVLKERKTLEERLGEIYKALADEKAKSNHLSKINAEMEAELLRLNEKLQNEIQSRLELEQVKLRDEFKLIEQLKENKIKIDQLQQQLAKKEAELSQIHIHDDDLNAFGELPPMEQIEDLFNSQFQANYFTNPVLKTPSSLPATENWPGEYNFRVFFASQENVKTQWVYSARKNKLYVNKDAPCPINFSANILLSNDFYIRTQPFFSSADHVLDKVHRCVNHSMLEIQNNKPEAEHLVRVQSFNAVYESDQSGRHSVVVPFENPPAGQQFSSYIFKFACFQSCSGGPNRRPLMLCFTLERRGGVVVGRQKVHLKICACPLRDCKLEEKPSLNSSENQTKKKGVKREREELCDTPQTLLNSSENQTKKKGVKREREELCDTPQRDNSERNYDMPVKVRPGPYYLKVEDRRNYEILKLMAKVFLHPSNKPLHRSSLINLIMSTYSSSGSEEEGKK